MKQCSALGPRKTAHPMSKTKYTISHTVINLSIFTSKQLTWQNIIEKGFKAGTIAELY